MLEWCKGRKSKSPAVHFFRRGAFIRLGVRSLMLGAQRISFPSGLVPPLDKVGGTITGPGAYCPLSIRSVVVLVIRPLVLCRKYQKSLYLVTEYGYYILTRRLIKAYRYLYSVAWFNWICLFEAQIICVAEETVERQIIWVNQVAGTDFASG